MDENTLRLKQIAFLLAAQTLHGRFAESTQMEKVAFLSRAGFSNQEIAEFIGITPAAVATSLYESKKGKVAKKKK